MFCMHRHRGFIALELIISIGVAAMLAGVVWKIVDDYARAHDYFAVHRRVQLAVESKMEQFRANAAIPREGTWTEREEAVTLEISRTPATGAWAGLNLVEIWAKTTARHGRTVTFALSAYLPGDGRSHAERPDENR